MLTTNSLFCYVESHECAGQRARGDGRHVGKIVMQPKVNPCNAGRRPEAGGKGVGVKRALLASGKLAAASFAPGPNDLLNRHLIACSYPFIHSRHTRAATSAKSPQHDNATPRPVIKMATAPRAFELPTIRYPIGGDGYAVSHALDDVERIREDLYSYGVTVVRGAYTAEECRASRDEIFAHMKSAYGFDISDRRTWDISYARTGICSASMPFKTPLFWPQLVKNRQKRSVVELFEALYEGRGVVARHDRVSVFRPAAVNPRWKSKVSLHLDMDVMQYHDSAAMERDREALEYRDVADLIKENNQPMASEPFLALQSGVVLTDNRLEDGGFHCIPGFQSVFNAFLHTPHAELCRRWRPCQFHEAHPFRAAAQRIPAKEGCMIIWDQRLPHGSAPNESRRFRIAHFQSYAPKECYSDRRRQRRAMLVAAELESAGSLRLVSGTGRQVFDIDCIDPDGIASVAPGDGSCDGYDSDHAGDRASGHGSGSDESGGSGGSDANERGGGGGEGVGRG